MFFNYISSNERIYDLPKIAPLSTRDVTIRNSVYQSVTPKEILRNKMINYLDNNLNQNDNIIRHLFIKVNKHQELPTKLKNEKK